jgi:26S proteasome regulatory subunit N6
MELQRVSAPRLAMASLQEQLDAAQASASTNPAGAVSSLKAVVFAEAASDAETVKVKEAAIQALCDALVKQQNAKGLADLLGELRTFFGQIPKAKTAKIVRGIIDSIAKIPGSTQLQVGASDLGLDQVSPPCGSSP